MRVHFERSKELFTSLVLSRSLVLKSVALFFNFLLFSLLLTLMFFLLLLLLLLASDTTLSFVASCRVLCRNYYLFSFILFLLGDQLLINLIGVLKGIVFP